MKIIQSIIAGQNEEGANIIAPSEPFPADAIQIVCNGQEYIVYQPGDELPPPPPMPDPATIQPEAA